MNRQYCVCPFYQLYLTPHELIRNIAHAANSSRKNGRIMDFDGAKKAFLIKSYSKDDRDTWRFCVCSICYGLLWQQCSRSIRCCSVVVGVRDCIFLAGHHLHFCWFCLARYRRLSTSGSGINAWVHWTMVIGISGSVGGGNNWMFCVNIYFTGECFESNQNLGFRTG